MCDAAVADGNGTRMHVVVLVLDGDVESIRNLRRLPPA